MKTTVRKSWLPLALVFAVLVFPSAVFGSSTSARKRSKSDRDINAIGQRKIGDVHGNWYSLEKEKETGARLSATFERSIAILRDPETGAYLDRLAHNIAQHSDAKMPVTVRIIDSEEVYALTLPGGYQYITRGLLLRMDEEGELASVLARGIAHTALRSSMLELSGENLAQIASIPPIFADQNPLVISTSNSEMAIPLVLLRMRRDQELDADYFGVQYVYKAGYDMECFIRFIQTVWPASFASRGAPLTAFSAFPPLSERLEVLKKETSDILPKRDRAVISTPEFADFQQHLRNLPKPPSINPEPELKRTNPEPPNA